MEVKGLRVREQAQKLPQTLRPFHVTRWRVDEPDNHPIRHVLSPSGDAATIHAFPLPCHPRISSSMIPSDRTVVIRGSPSTRARPPLCPPSFIFPLSTDHLLHLVQYNVFRAFVSNKRTLNTLLTGWTEKPPTPTDCPISGPYRDDTSVYPLNPNIPAALSPTLLQQTRLHSIWINLLPFPCIRDNLIMHEETFNHWDLLQDLIGELMSATPDREQQGTPITITVSNPETIRPVPVTTECEEDGMTANRRGLIVWGEPHKMRSWEATPSFLTKWSWAVKGCDQLVEHSNYWRRMRGEDPIRLGF